MCINGERTFVRRLSRAVDLNVEVSEVVLVGDGTDTWNTTSRAVLGCDLRAQEGPLCSERITYGSAISLSVSLMIRFGRAILEY